MVFAFAVRFLDHYHTRSRHPPAWVGLGLCVGGLKSFAVVIVVGKRPVNRSDPGS